MRRSWTLIKPQCLNGHSWPYACARIQSGDHLLRVSVWVLPDCQLGAPHQASVDRKAGSLQIRHTVAKPGVPHQFDSAHEDRGFLDQVSALMHGKPGAGINPKLP